MPATSSLARFGVFELDLSTGELSKNGRRLRLQEQPFRVLRLLVEQRGEAVSRESLKEALWPADTFVDFDHSLNAAVAKLRQALGDSAENPRFIETMARRGYRFIAPVEFVGNSNGAVAAVEPAGEAVILPSATGTGRKFSRLLAYGISVLVLVVIAFWLWNRKPSGEMELVKLTEDSGLTTDPAVSPDGKLLAYAADRGSNGNLNIWIQQLGAGGSAVQLTHDNVDASEPDFSPDGTRIAFRSKRDVGGIYTIPVIGGEPTRLAQSGRSPRFSPDGRWIAYSSGARDLFVNEVGAFYSAAGTLYVISTSGGEPRRLGADLFAVANPVWSPDGGHLLVYVSPENGFDWNEADWWIVSLDGTPSRPSGIFKELRRQGFSLGFDRVPRLAQWTRGSITFSAGFGDTVNAWRAPISREGHLTGRAERLTSGTTLEISPTFTASGELVFASLNRNLSLWSLSADTDRTTIGGEFKRITQGAAAVLPSISTDGRVLAFTAVRSRRHNGSDEPVMVTHDAAELQVVIKDLSTGRERILANGDTAQWHPQISRDGSMIAYTSNKPGPIYVASVDDGRPKMIADGRNLYAWDWSLDNSRLLFDRADTSVHVADLRAGNEEALLASSDLGLFQAKFSPDDGAIVVVGCGPQGRSASGCRIHIVPVENGVPARIQQWIPIDHAGRWDDKPRWSPSGELIYFVSDRDSYLCLWAQRVERHTKRLIGIPYPVYHFHNSRLAMANVDTGVLEIAVAKDKIVLGLGELTGNIWSLRRK